jgi:hypothetical protein
MIQLDRDALLYLISVAKDAGFDVKKVDSCESEGPPCITLELIQSRIVPLEPAKKSDDLRQGVSEEQAAEIAKKGKATLLDGTEL